MKTNEHFARQCAIDHWSMIFGFRPLRQGNCTCTISCSKIAQLILQFIQMSCLKYQYQAFYIFHTTQDKLAI